VSVCQQALSQVPNAFCRGCRHATSELLAAKVEALHLRQTTIHKQFGSGHVAAVIQRQKQHDFADLIGCAELPSGVLLDISFLHSWPTSKMPEGRSVLVCLSSPDSLRSLECGNPLSRKRRLCCGKANIAAAAGDERTLSVERSHGRAPLAGSL